MSVPPILWQPSERAIEEAQVTRFARQLIRKHRLELNSYPEFHRWTVENAEVFWSELWDWCGVIASRKGGTVLVDGDKMPGARWFPEARLNLPRTCCVAATAATRSCSGTRAGSRRRELLGRTSEVSRAARRCRRSAARRATAPPRSSPTCPRPAC